MDNERFRAGLLQTLSENMSALQTPDREWIIKGFIDVHKNIYAISLDTKVISKIIELMIFPLLCKFAAENQLELHPAQQQNHYPDVTFVDPRDDSRIALDLKSTYRVDSVRANGFTLGAFTGYFRNRDTRKNILFPYSSYSAHFILGILYDRNDAVLDETKIYSLNDLGAIASAVSNLDVLLQEKYRIASTKPGSGNTKNIGSVTSIDKLIRGEGPFAKLGVSIFDDYWMYYMMREMAGGTPPYSNLEEYFYYKSRCPNPASIEGIEED